LKRIQVPLLIILALLVSDQASKIWVRKTIPLFMSSNLIPSFIDLTHVENPGVSFSLLGDAPDAVRVPLLAGISLAAVVFLSWYWIRNRSELGPWLEAAFVLILPGAAGNLIDRVLQGTVTDFFHFRFGETSFFVNNLADIYISLGVVSYMIGSIRIHRDERRRDGGSGGGI